MMFSMYCTFTSRSAPVAYFVTPAKAGGQLAAHTEAVASWIPAYARMTDDGGLATTSNIQVFA